MTTPTKTQDHGGTFSHLSGYLRFQLPVRSVVMPRITPLFACNLNLKTVSKSDKANE